VTPKVSAMDWTYLSGLVAAREGRMLTREFFRQLASEPDLDAVLHRLGETVFENRLPDAAAVQRLDEIAAEILAECAAELRGLCPSDVATCHFDVKEAFADLRGFVEKRRAGADGPEPSPESEPDEGEGVWERLWDGLPADVPDSVRRAALRARDVLPAAAEQPELLDAAIDAECLRALREEAERRGNDFITGYWRRAETARALESLWRARLLGLEQAVQDALVGDLQDGALVENLARADEADWPDVLGAAVPGVQAARLRDLRGAARVREFVRQMDEALADYVRQARSVAFGPERVFGYAIGMQTEVFNLKLMVGGRAADVAPALLEERLRPGYV